MGNPWFRMYSEFRTDPKVQTMSESMQRRYIMLMCLESDGDLQKLTDAEIAFALNLTKSKLIQTKLELIRKNLIEVIDEKIHIRNWDKRQYVSDTSTDRVKKHREKVANETLQKRLCNGDVTPPDTDTDTDTEGKEPPMSPDAGDCDGEPAKADDPPKPEAVPAIPAGMLYHTPGEQERRKQAKAIITDLNARCGKAFPDTGGILSVILERLREGRHPPEFEKIITNKLADPHFQANPSLYTPNTLFRKTHFDQYLTEKPSDYTTGGKHGGRDYQSGRKRHIAERPIEEQAKPHGEEAF